MCLEQLEMPTCCHKGCFDTWHCHPRTACWQGRSSSLEPSPDWCCPRENVLNIPAALGVSFPCWQKGLHAQTQRGDRRKNLCECLSWHIPHILRMLLWLPSCWVTFLCYCSSQSQLLFDLRAIRKNHCMQKGASNADCSIVISVTGHPFWWIKDSGLGERK